MVALFSVLLEVACYLTRSTLNPTNASFVTQANFWCMVDVVVKLRRLLPIPTLALISLGVTLLVRARCVCTRTLVRLFGFFYPAKKFF